MANSPTIANFGTYNTNNNDEPTTPVGTSADTAEDELESPSSPVAQADDNRTDHETTDMDVTMVQPREPEPATEAVGGASGEPSTDAVTTTQEEVGASAKDKDGFYSLRLTPLIDHSSSSSGLYFAPIIRRTRSSQVIRIGRYTEKNKAAAHAPQGSDAPIVFKSKVVSRTHALFQCNEDGQWFVKDCKSSSGTFLNHIRLSPASQESSLMPLIDGDIIQLGMDYRGGTEEVYRCVKMRCEFNKSWQRKVNQFNLEIHQKLKNLSLQQGQPEADDNPLSNALKSDELSECAICLLKLEPCQALFISPCSHSWHYKCIRPIIIKSYPQFYCPNCRSMCDLETDIEDEDE
ncbi:SMAD/FHA domain-containing protein [Yamadazyma tenuis ATCC 10573]|uniref:SMAD/FHA domain-containing protein n=2 Tax=Candida tenuis TaxID=2315449 RepID=G3B7W3_CANTC|nr:SMAD/FHA domain-containing protein [Yamadazyma tenuis ATCC 10573]EGV61672.1 SMAD/FHA domain-containing protein [Yamadazyma tenuis ATCC 10573]